MGNVFLKEELRSLYYFRYQEHEVNYFAQLILYWNVDVQKSMGNL